MPSLNLTKEDVNKQLADLRESLVASVDNRIAEIKRDVDLVTQVRLQAMPHHADGVISVVNEFLVYKEQYRDVNWTRLNMGALGTFEANIPTVELAPGRYRVFIHVHKVPE